MFQVAQEPPLEPGWTGPAQGQALGSWSLPGLQPAVRVTSAFAPWQPHLLRPERLLPGDWPTGPLRGPQSRPSLLSSSGCVLAWPIRPAPLLSFLD